MELVVELLKLFVGLFPQLLKVGIIARVTEFIISIRHNVGNVGDWRACRAFLVAKSDEASARAWICPELSC